MEQCWRWYGPDDPVPLDHVKQAGATGIVTALHHIYDGRAWPEDEILKRKREIEDGRSCLVRGREHPGSQLDQDRRAGAAALCRLVQGFDPCARQCRGSKTICYNFMPVVDWTRTDLMYRLPTTGYALRFDAIDFAAYDLFVLEAQECPRRATTQSASPKPRRG